MFECIAAVNACLFRLYNILTFLDFYSGFASFGQEIAFSYVSTPLNFAYTSSK